MAISGSKREIPQGGDFPKKVGIFEAKVIAINPNEREYKDILGIELKEDSNATNYYDDVKKKLRVNVWLQDVNSDFKTNATFWLEHGEKENKDATKKQYINSIGVCSWASSPDLLPVWFLKRDYRIAHIGEEEFLGFVRIWLGGLDFSDLSTEIMLDWKKVMSGDLKDLKEQIDGEFTQTVGALATVKTVDKEDGPKSYQNIFIKSFFPGYSIKSMRVVDYNNPDVVRGLTFRKSAELKMHERFVVNVAGEYGCKDYYTFKELHDYDPEANLVESDKVIAADSSDF
tara:strand:+ start:1969 stop:2826 length:858 start_codon:yes stop_codon:yes gene_type:complete